MWGQGISETHSEASQGISETHSFSQILVFHGSAVFYLLIKNRIIAAIGIILVVNSERNIFPSTKSLWAATRSNSPSQPASIRTDSLRVVSSVCVVSGLRLDRGCCWLVCCSRMSLGSSRLWNASHGYPILVFVGIRTSVNGFSSSGLLK